MNAGRRRPAAQSVQSKTAHLAFGPRAPIVGRGSGPEPARRRVKGSRSRENVIVEVVTPIAVGDNAFGRLSLLQ